MGLEPELESSTPPTFSAYPVISELFFVADAEDLGDGDRDAEQTQAEIHRDDQQQQQHVERVHLADATEHQLKTFPI